MHILSALLYALSANIDCLAIAIMYEMNHIRISIKANICISFISAIGTYGSMKIGNLLRHLLHGQANILGSVLLCILGIYFLYSFCCHKDHNSTKPSYQTITFFNLIVLAGTLTMNNVALGIGASITGIPYVITSIASFIISFVCLFVGQIIGRSFLASTCKKYPELLSSILLILLAIYEFFI